MDDLPPRPLAPDRWPPKSKTIGPLKLVHAVASQYRQAHQIPNSDRDNCRQGSPSHPWDGDNLWLFPIGPTSTSPKCYFNTMSSPQITHKPSLGPNELDPRSFDDSSPLIILDCDFVSQSQHGSSPNQLLVKSIELTACQEPAPGKPPVVLKITDTQ